MCECIFELGGTGVVLLCFVNGLCVSRMFFLRVKHHTAVLVKEPGTDLFGEPGPLCPGQAGTSRSVGSAD